MTVIEQVTRLVELSKAHVPGNHDWGLEEGWDAWADDEVSTTLETAIEVDHSSDPEIESNIHQLSSELSNARAKLASA